MSLNSAIRKKIDNRVSACRASAQAVIQALEKFGIRAAAFGSTVRGQVHQRSDIDILIFDRNGHSRGHIVTIADEASSVPVDLLFAEDVKPDTLRRIEAEIGNGHYVA